MAALTTLNMTFTPSRIIQALLSRGSTDYKNIDGGSTVSQPVISLMNTSAGVAVANTAANGADQCLSAIFPITASGTTTIDLTSFTDCVGRTAQSFARVKFLFFRNVSLAQDPTYGGSASQVTIGAAGSNPFVMNLGGTTPTKIVKLGEFDAWGTNGATGYTVSGTNKNILITNNDATNAASVEVVVIGGTT
jgi:hypothetical protein